MSLMRILFIIASLSTCSYSELSPEDAIDEIFMVYTPLDPIERVDSMLTKRIALSSRYNFLLSPLGLKLTLCSLAEAAAGDTRQEILSLLGFDLNDYTTTKYVKITNFIKENLQSSSSRNLGSWIYLPYGLLPQLKVLKNTEDIFYTLLKKSSSLPQLEAAEEINLLVRDITNGTFDNLFNEYEHNEKTILVFNTFFYQKPWRHPFLPGDTKVAKFYVSPTILKDVPFMHTYDFFGFAKSAIFDAKILGMNLKDNEIMYFIVPNSLTGLPRVLDNLSILNSELANITKSYVQVTIPKFKMDYTSQLSGILKELGVRKAFQEDSSFPGYSPFPLKEYKLNRLMQFFDFQVTEYGTGVKVADGTRTKDSPQNGDDEVIANRPFLFFIRHTKVNEFLLMGRISDPTNTQTYFEAVSDVN